MEATRSAATAAHFFGIGAQLMRRILIDHARAHHAAKQGSKAWLFAELGGRR